MPFASRGRVRSVGGLLSHRCLPCSGTATGGRPCRWLASFAAACSGPLFHTPTFDRKEQFNPDAWTWQGSSFLSCNHSTGVVPVFKEHSTALGAGDSTAPTVTTVLRVRGEGAARCEGLQSLPPEGKWFCKEHIFLCWGDSFCMTSVRIISKG